MMSRRLRLAIPLVTLAVLCTESGAGAHRLLGQGHQRSPHNSDHVADAVHAASLQREPMSLFKQLVKLAEDFYSSYENLEAAVMMLRTAFLLCPDCRYDDFSGEKFREVFSIDNLGDRLFLTQEIIPAIIQNQKEGGTALKLLWAGSHPYTLRYEYLLKGVDMVSVDPNPAVAIYGSSNSHLVDSLQNIGSHAQPDTFDMAIVNGVLGWGIDTEAQVTSFLKAVHKVLKPGGILIVGFNRHMHKCCTFEPYFEPSSFQGLPQTKDFEGQWKHTYEIFRKV